MEYILLVLLHLLPALAHLVSEPKIQKGEYPEDVDSYSRVGFSFYLSSCTVLLSMSNTRGGELRYCLLYICHGQQLLQNSLSLVQCLNMSRYVRPRIFLIIFARIVWSPPWKCCLPHGKRKLKAFMIGFPGTPDWIQIPTTDDPKHIFAGSRQLRRHCEREDLLEAKFSRLKTYSA